MTRFRMYLCKIVQREKLIASIIFVAALITAIVIYITKADIDSLKEREAIVIQEAHEHMWSHVDYTLSITWERNRIYAESLKQRILQRIAKEYSDTDELKKDLSDYSIKETLFQKIILEESSSFIAQHNLRQNNINVVVATSTDILYDSNPVAPAAGYVPGFDSLLITTQADNYANRELFIHGLSKAINGRYSMLDVPYVDTTPADGPLRYYSDLKSAFTARGHVGLNHYALLSPAYIHDNYDFFGVYNRHPNGSVRLNDKVCVIIAEDAASIVKELDAKTHMLALYGMKEKENRLFYERALSTKVDRILITVGLFIVIVIVITYTFYTTRKLL